MSSTKTIFQVGLNNTKTILKTVIYLQQGDKMNSLARSSASLYGNKEELYDRLRRHAYQGKKGIRR
jgi:hypothetical protein